MRRFGAMPYITPLHRATESSTMPKSVMKTTVGGGCWAGGCYKRGPAARNKPARTRPNDTEHIRADFVAAVNVIRIALSAPVDPSFYPLQGRTQRRLRASIIWSSSSQAYINP